MKYRGTVEVPNLSDENDMDDLDVSQQLPLPDNTDHYNDCCVNDSIDDHIPYSDPDLSVSV